MQYMKKILLVSLLLFCGCQPITINEGDVLTIVGSSTTEKVGTYQYNIQDNRGVVHTLRTSEKYSIADHVKIVKVEPQ